MLTHETLAQMTIFSVTFPDGRQERIMCDDIEIYLSDNGLYNKNEYSINIEGDIVTFIRSPNWIDLDRVEEYEAMGPIFIHGEEYDLTYGGYVDFHSDPIPRKTIYFGCSPMNAWQPGEPVNVNDVRKYYSDPCCHDRFVVLRRKDVVVVFGGWDDELVPEIEKKVKHKSTDMVDLDDFKIDDRLIAKFQRAEERRQSGLQSNLNHMVSELSRYHYTLLNTQVKLNEAKFIEKARELLEKDLGTIESQIEKIHNIERVKDIYPYHRVGIRINLEPFEFQDGNISYQFNNYILIRFYNNVIEFSIHNFHPMVKDSIIPDKDIIQAISNLLSKFNFYDAVKLVTRYLEYYNEDKAYKPLSYFRHSIVTRGAEDD